MDIKKIVNNRVLRQVLLCGFKVLSAVNQIFPKNSKKIVLYDSFNTRLEDNTRALMNFLIENGYQKKYLIICAMPRNRSYDEYKRYGVKTVGAVGSIINYLNCTYFFTSFGNTRIKPSKKQMVINQWHGTPLKTIGSFGGDHKEEKLDYFTYTLAASEFFKPIMAKAFGCSESRILVMGHSRNDYLFYEGEVLSKFGFGSNYSKTFIWMPTFRRSNDQKYDDGYTSDNQTLLPILNAVSDYEEFNGFLKENNSLLVIKVHNYSCNLAIHSLSNIKIISNLDLAEKKVELYELIKDFDALITDYSSVYFDYLLIDKPIGFTIDDYDQYLKNRGFIFEDTMNYMPGAHIKEISDLKAFIADVIHEQDNYRQERERINDLSNTYHDGDERKRLLDFVGIRK